MSDADNNRRTDFMARTVRTKVYQYHELSEEAKKKAIESFYDINVDYNWWESTYEDAKRIDLEIEGFDDYKVEGKFKYSAINTANLIIKEHGEECETFKTAFGFVFEYAIMYNRFWEEYFSEDVDGKLGNGFYSYPEEYIEYEKDEDLEDLQDDFLKSLLEDYRIMLNEEYEYQTSEEAIVETIEANEYEFTKDGKKF